MYRAMGQPGLGSYYEYAPEQVFAGSPAAGTGAYYEFSPHETFNGMGSYYEFVPGSYQQAGMGEFDTRMSPVVLGLIGLAAVALVASLVMKPTKGTGRSVPF